MTPGNCFDSPLTLKMATTQRSSLPFMAEPAYWML
jgi:hypothetical protein